MEVKSKEPFKQYQRPNSYDNSKHYNNEHGYASISDVGKTIISEKFPSTMDGFWFSVSYGTIINPFDFVSVENLYNTRTVGIVKELQAIKADNLGLAEKVQQKDITVAKVAVMGNTGTKLDGMKGNVSISMPIRIDKAVNLANVDELVFALGIPQMEAPIPIGVIEMPNGLKVPVSLAISYLAGPDAAHVNASGISGNLKTSYLLFLLQSMYQNLSSKDSVSMIIFNTREEDLLHIHENQENVSERDKELFKLLQLDVKPFDNVSYFLPRGRDGKPLSIHIPNNFRTYSYELQDIYDRLELLFSETYDPRYNLSSIIDYIYESWPLIDESGRVIENWSDLFRYKDYPQEIITHKSTLLHFLGQLQRFRKSTMFTDKRLTSTYLGKEIKNIKARDILVIDIAMIPTLEEQSFVVADVMKNIDQLYSVRHNLDDTSYDNSTNYNNTPKVEGNIGNRTIRRPTYTLIFIDEINRFLPKSNPLGIRSAVAEQIMKTIIAGKSRNTILFSAQQFKSEVDYTLHENTGLHITAKLGTSELSTKPYNMIDKCTKMNIARLNKGEIVMIQPAFRQPIKITFPRASFKRPNR